MQKQKPLLTEKSTYPLQNPRFTLIRIYNENLVELQNGLTEDRGITDVIERWNINKRDHEEIYTSIKMTEIL